MTHGSARKFVASPLPKIEKGVLAQRCQFFAIPEHFAS